MKIFDNRIFTILAGGIVGILIYAFVTESFFSSIPSTTVSSAEVPKNVIPTALEIYRKGLADLTPLLEEKSQGCYQGNNEYLEKFPFSDYSLIDVPGQGKFFVDPINDSIKNCLRARLPWEGFIKGVIERFVQPGTIALDIGAHIGTHTLTMSRCVGSEGKVLAFEPNKKVFRELCMNLAINKKTNVHPIRCALGKEKDIITIIASHPNNEGGAYVIKQQLGINTAALLPLDQFQLSDISFIKMDVENMEAEVLDGAVATIKRCRPIMLIEVQGNAERPIQLGENAQQKAVESLEKIISLGYRLERIGNTHDFLAFPI